MYCITLSATLTVSNPSDSGTILFFGMTSNMQSPFCWTKLAGVDVLQRDLHTGLQGDHSAWTDDTAGVQGQQDSRGARMTKLGGDLKGTISCTQCDQGHMDQGFEI